MSKCRLDMSKCRFYMSKCRLDLSKCRQSYQKVGLQVQNVDIVNNIVKKKKDFKKNIFRIYSLAPLFIMSTF